MRRQFVLDRQTDQLIEDLASARAGNRSFVVREAVQVYAAIANQLEDLEADPKFLAMMERSASDIRSGRVVSHADLKKRVAARKRANRGPA